MAKLSCLHLEQWGNTVRPSDCHLVYNSSLETHNHVACTILWVSEVATCTHSEAFTIGGEKKKPSKMNENIWENILGNTRPDLKK